MVLLTLFHSSQKHPSTKICNDHVAMLVFIKGHEKTSLGIFFFFCSLFFFAIKVLAPLPIGFAVFMVHLATIPITGTGINPARSFGAAVIFNQSKAWDDHVRISSFSSPRL